MRTLESVKDDTEKNSGTRAIVAEGMGKITRQ